MQYRKFGKLDWKVSALCWLLFGNGSLTKGKSGITQVCLATIAGAYPPAGWQVLFYQA
jgi:4-amino-4-deoxy-L-arabinose transferase-like glycosyltransferase